MQHKQRPQSKIESRPIYFLEDKQSERKREFKVYDEKDLNRLMPKGFIFPENREDVSFKFVDLKNIMQKECDYATDEEDIRRSRAFLKKDLQ